MGTGSAGAGRCDLVPAGRGQPSPGLAAGRPTLGPSALGQHRGRWGRPRCRRRHLRAEPVRWLPGGLSGARAGGRWGPPRGQTQHDTTVLGPPASHSPGPPWGEVSAGGHTGREAGDGPGTSCRVCWHLPCPVSCQLTGAPDRTRPVPADPPTPTGSASQRREEGSQALRLRDLSDMVSGAVCWGCCAASLVGGGGAQGCFVGFSKSRSASRVCWVDPSCAHGSV